MKKWVSELTIKARGWFDEKLVSFSMEEIVVDGIPSSRFNNRRMLSHHSSPIIGVKNAFDDDAEEDEDGYLLSIPAWCDPYRPVPYAEGEIDYEVWYYGDILVGVRNTDYEYYKQVSDDIKKSKIYLVPS